MTRRSPTGPACWAIAIAAAVVVGWSAPLSAQSTAHAGELYLSADFEGARREAREVVAAEATSRQDLVGALRLLVALESMLGTPARARQAAALLVLLDPTAEPASGAPEEATAMVAAARTAPRPSLEVSFGTGVGIATPSDAPTLSTTLVLECEDAAGSRTVRGVVSAPLRQPVDATHDARCRGQLRTMSGIVLVEDEERYRTSGGPAAGPRDDTTLWIALGVGGGVLVTVLFIGVGVAVSGSPAEATFGAPVVIGW